MRLLRTLVAGIGLGLGVAHAASPLPALVIDPNEISVSGLSAGGYMAVQMHVAFSSTFRKGVGVAAGGPFFCAEGSLSNATGRCMQHDTSIPVNNLATLTRTWASNGWIDPVSHLAGSKVYLFSGTEDSAVRPAVSADLRSYYTQFIPPTQVVYKNDIPAEHAMVTDDFGSSCAVKNPPYINDCDFDLAGEMLWHLYGVLNPRTTGPLQGSLVEFDQRPFGPGHGLGETGLAFIPQTCAAGMRCKLHVVLHGCRQNKAELGDLYAQRSGYNRWADTNNMVVLYPQTSPSATNGCWDWWGYDHADYAKKTGPQMKALKGMVDRVASGSPVSALPAPLNVTASQPTPNSMQLSWSAVAQASGYYLYRQGTRVSQAPIAGTSIVDTGLNPGTTYTWTVKAIDAQGLESAPSIPASGTTTGTPAATCVLASNYAHVNAGRAYVTWWALVYAKGSNQYMGFYNIFTSTRLKQTGPGTYVVGSCP